MGRMLVGYVGRMFDGIGCSRDVYVVWMWC